MIFILILTYLVYTKLIKTKLKAQIFVAIIINCYIVEHVTKAIKNIYFMLIIFVPIINLLDWIDHQSSRLQKYQHHFNFGFKVVELTKFKQQIFTDFEFVPIPFINHHQSCSFLQNQYIQREVFLSFWVSNFLVRVNFKRVDQYVKVFYSFQSDNSTFNFKLD